VIYSLLSGAAGKEVELYSSFNGGGSTRVFNILLQDDENIFFKFLLSTLSMKTEPENILCHNFKIRMKTQILGTIQIEATSVTWKSGLLTQCIQIKNDTGRQTCIWGQTKATDGNSSEVWYESECG